MARKRKTSQLLLILCRPGQSVKARIAGAGIRQGVLAAAAGMAQSTFCGYLSGRRRNLIAQLAIADAFRKLTRQRLDASQFWGDLWTDKP